MIRYYANKIVEDGLYDTETFSICVYFDEYKDEEFIKEHKEEILNLINLDEKVADVEVDEETEMPVVLDASKSKYASEGCSYQWYEIKVGAASVHNADEIEKIQNANGNKFEWNVGEFKNGVYCRIRTQDGIPYDVFYKKK